MAYEFPPDIERRIRDQIDNGNFGSEDEVLREAMDTLEKRQRGLEQLQQMVHEADDDIAAGRVAPFAADQTKRVVRERLAQDGITD